MRNVLPENHEGGGIYILECDGILFDVYIDDFLGQSMMT